jgi:stearoyl-CoA desaturase (delta-9 desaturase)
MYQKRHLEHHRNSDRSGDPHSPHLMTVSQLLAPITTPPDVLLHSDWPEKNIYQRYPMGGQWVSHATAGILFGLLGFVFSIVIKQLTYKWLPILATNWVFHKVGFKYAGHKHPTDQSKNLLPFGIIMAGEELHNNHHNQPTNPNFAQRWFEFDIGYMYAIILRNLGLLEFTNKKTIQQNLAK